MRYFISLSLPEALLPLSIIELTFSTFCVLFGGSFEGILSRFMTTGITAILLTPITVTTDQSGFIAKDTVKQTTTFTHRHKTMVRAGFTAV